MKIDDSIIPSRSDAKVMPSVVMVMSSPPMAISTAPVVVPPTTVPTVKVADEETATIHAVPRVPIAAR